MAGPLIQISLQAEAGKESEMAVLLENIFRTSPVIYTDAETNQTTCSIYLSEAAWKKSPLKITKIRSQDWAEVWKKHFKPLSILGKLLIKPSWSKANPPKGAQALVLDPGLSFGTGHHPTTSFCLKEIVRNAGRAKAFLDLGTGSGILSIAASKLGYSPVYAIENDVQAVRIARRNARANCVRIRFSAANVLTFKPTRRFDLICANLTEDLVVTLMPRFPTWIVPGGRLAIAGVLKKQFRKIKESSQKAGLSLLRTEQKGEWQSALFGVFKPSLRQNRDFSEQFLN